MVVLGNALTGADHKRTHVQGRTGTEGRNPGGVGRNDLLDGLNELVLGGNGASRGAAQSYTYARRSCRRRKQTMLCPRRCRPSGPQRPPGSNGRYRRTPETCRAWSVVRPPSSHLAILPMSLVAVIGLHVAKAEATPIDILLLDSHMSLLTCGCSRTRTGTEGRPRRVARPERKRPDGTRRQHQSRWHVDCMHDCTPRRIKPFL